MRTLTAIVALILLVPAVPGTGAVAQAAEPACKAEAATYLAASDASTARSDLLFCLLGDAATNSDIVVYGEEDGAYYKAYPSTFRVRYIAGGSGGTGIDSGGWSGMALYSDCPPSPPVAKLVDDGGTRKMEDGLFTFSVTSLSKTMAENMTVRDLFATEWQAPLALDLGMASTDTKPGRIIDYVWKRANSDMAATVAGGTGCPTDKKIVLVPTGGQYWNITDPWSSGYGTMVETRVLMQEFME